MNRQQKIYLDMIGCRLNQSEIEHIGSQVRMAGHELVGEAEQADIAILNTCAVTAKAAAESRKLSRRVERDGVQNIILTGCWASLETKAAASLPGVVQVIHNSNKADIPQLFPGPGVHAFDLEPLQRHPLPGARKRTRAFIKVQDGCDKHCTFCVTTLARGKSKSEPLEQILEKVQEAISGGVKEVILSGVHLGAWGLDLSTGERLEHLLRSILHHTELQRLRLSSLEPWEISDRLLALWQNPRLCAHLHLPLQSGSAMILRRMARSTNPARFQSLVERIRQRYPWLAITTDIIVGFPGESELEFEQSLNYVDAMQFSGGHVFSYSERPGTSASTFPNQVPPPIRKQRNQRMRCVLEAATRKYQSKFIGRTLSILWESLVEVNHQGWIIRGTSSEGIRVEVPGTPSDLNTISRAWITHQNDELALVGKKVNSLPKA